MRKKGRIYQLAIALLLCFLQMAGIAMYGQDRPRAASKRAQRHQTDTLNTVVNRDSLTVADSLAAENKRKMLEMTASPDLKEQPVPTDSLQKAIDPKGGYLIPQKPPGLPSSFPAVDKFTTASIGNCPSSMEDLPVVPMPLRGTARCIRTIRPPTRMP